jgi:uncharacterized protein (DUF885 family)
MKLARVIAVLTAAAITTAATAAAQPVNPEASWRVGRSTELLQLLDEHVEWLLRESPEMASGRGDKRYNDRLDDVSAMAVERRLRDSTSRLARLKAMERSGWTEADLTEAGVLEFELESDLRSAAFHPEQKPISAQNGPQVSLPQLADRLSFADAKDLADFATRLEAIPALIDDHISNMRSGLVAERVPPRVAMAGTVEQCAAIVESAATPAISPFFSPYRRLPEADPIAQRARRAISEGVGPAFARLQTFLRDEYIPKCRESVGISESVDGVAAYDAALLNHTTLPVTSEQVHTLGLSEVARIRAEMLTVIARTDWDRKAEYSGDAQLAAFLQYLRTDPRFYYTDSEELLRGYRDISKRIDAELPRLFKSLPRLSYGVREIPLFAAKTSPTAYYYRGSLKGGIPAWFMANTYRLDQRPKYEMISLTLHEAVPGHHLQSALHEELEGVHPIRTMVWLTAYGEGWALYAERLGLEVGEGENGFYSDPYDDFGRLTYEMWRACRLVVDTGIHAKKWTRQQAIDFMLANTGLSAHNIEREVDRYIAWPGQATAYKMGELKIRELRTLAEQQLGDRFDVREFHDAVLGAGPLPLPALESRVKRWIAAAAAAG